MTYPSSRRVQLTSEDMLALRQAAASRMDALLERMPHAETAGHFARMEEYFHAQLQAYRKLWIDRDNHAYVRNRTRYFAGRFEVAFSSWIADHPGGFTQLLQLANTFETADRVQGMV